MADNSFFVIFIYKFGKPFESYIETCTSFYKFSELKKLTSLVVY